MAKILRKEVLTVFGDKNECEFIGVQVGEFILRPDSSSEMRSDLRITKGKTSLVVQGGPSFLRIWTKDEGLGYAAFQRQLSQEDKLILRQLAYDLSGWIWPDIGEVLKRKVEKLGEDNILRALQDLFRGVKGTMRRIKLYQRLPFIGPCLISSIERVE